MGVSAAGAVLGGILYRLISRVPITPWHITAMLCAAAAGLLTATLWYGIRAKTVTRAAYNPRRSY